MVFVHPESDRRDLPAPPLKPPPLPPLSPPPRDEPRNPPLELILNRFEKLEGCARREQSDSDEEANCAFFSSRWNFDSYSNEIQATFARNHRGGGVPPISFPSPASPSPS